MLTSKVNWLVAHGYDVDILTCQPEVRPSAYGIDPRVSIIPLDIPYAEDFHVPIHKRLCGTLKKMRLHRKRIEAYLQEAKPDIVITTHIAETAFLPKLKDGSIKLLEAHSSAHIYRLEKRAKPWSLRSLLVKFYEWRDRHNLKQFTRAISLTREDINLRGNAPNAIAVPNPTPFRDIVPSPLNSNILLTIGRLTPEKNFAELINIWSKVAPEYPSWKLRIVGGGMLYNTLQEQIQRLKLEDSVELYPETRDVVALYQNADIFAMTSRFEGMPMTLLEAKSAGLPIISYACPCGPRDLIQDGIDGFLIPQGNKELFAQKLRCLLSDPERKQAMGRASHQSAQSYQLDAVMAQWTNLFDELLQSRN